MNKTIKSMLALLMVISMIAPAMANGDDTIVAEANAVAHSGGDSVYTYASVTNPSGMIAETGSAVTGDNSYGYSNAYGTQSDVSANSGAWSWSSLSGGYAESWSSAEIPDVTESGSYAITDDGGYAGTNANAGTDVDDEGDYSNTNAYAYNWYWYGYDDNTYTNAYTHGNSETGSTQVSVDSYADGTYAQSSANAGTVVEDNDDIQSNGDAYAQGNNYASSYSYGYANIYDNSSNSATATGNAWATGTGSADADVWGYSYPNWAYVYTYGSGNGQATASTSIDVSVVEGCPV